MNRNALLSGLHRAGLSSFLRFLKGDRITILSLHRVSHERDYFFNPLTPDKFEELVKYALKHYTVLSFSELGDLKKPLKKAPLLFSFDDGYYDFYEFALPILRKFRIPSNHNIVNECANDNKPIWTQRLNSLFNHCRSNELLPVFDIADLTFRAKDYNGDWHRFYMDVFHSLLPIPKPGRTKIIEEKERQLSVDSAPKMMGWKEIIECAENKVEIGSHTYTHDVVSTVPTRESLEYEIVRSKDEIEQRVKRPVRILALPNGQGNQFVNDFVRDAGFKYLLYVNDSVNKITSDSHDGFRILQRINMMDESQEEMVLRAELFHSRARKYVGLFNKKA